MACNHVTLHSQELLVFCRVRLSWSLRVICQRGLTCVCERGWSTYTIGLTNSTATLSAKVGSPSSGTERNSIKTPSS